MTVYEAICACYGGPEEEAEHGFKTERKHTAVFEAESKEDAVRDALRWYRRMAKVFPETYFELWSIKVYEMFFASIDAEGMCRTGLGGAFFEWKHDYPDTLEEKIQDLHLRGK